MKTASEIINTIHRAIGDGDKHGLRNTAALLEALDAFPKVPVVHIAGTNGKGSTCALISNVLTVSGYQTGLYTSPFLQIYNERIRLNGTPVSDFLLEKYGNRVLDKAEQLKSKGIHCTPFELGTALALSIFKGEHTDIQVLETGMGGRLDPTNAVPCATVCGITAIGMDHMQYLGDTLEKIAAEKAGIIRTETTVVCQPGTASVEQVFRKTAEEKHAPLIQLGKEMIADIRLDPESCMATFSLNGIVFENLRINLAGEHQLMNALTALAVLLELRKHGMQISDESIRKGFGNVTWPARLEWFENRILLDGAHNAHGVHALRLYTDQILKDRKKILLTGVLTEKLSEEMLSEMKCIADKAVTVTPNSIRAMKAEPYSVLLNQAGIESISAPDITEGLRIAEELAGQNGIVIATGSLYFVGELRSILQIHP